MALVVEAYLCATPKTEASQFSFWRTFSSTSSPRSQGETCFRNCREQHIIKYLTSFQIITNIVINHNSQPDSLLPVRLQWSWHSLHRPHWVQSSLQLSQNWVNRRWHHQCIIVITVSSRLINCRASKLVLLLNNNLINFISNVLGGFQIIWYQMTMKYNKAPASGWWAKCCCWSTSRWTTAAMCAGSSSTTTTERGRWLKSMLANWVEFQEWRSTIDQSRWHQKPHWSRPVRQR